MHNLYGKERHVVTSAEVLAPGDHRVEYEFAKDDGSIVMWFRKYPVVYNRDLTGMTSTPVIFTPFWNTWNYRI